MDLAERGVINMNPYPFLEANTIYYEQVMYLLRAHVFPLTKLSISSWSENRYRRFVRRC